MKTLTCFCEHNFSVDIPDTIDLDKEKDTAEKILNGSFLTFTCPQCGNLLKPEFPVHLISKIKDIDIFLVPEIERNSFMTGALKYPGKRIVIGFPELQERFKLLKYGLDEKAVEMIKVYFLEKADSSKDIKIYFGKRENAHLIFYIEGLKESETAITKIPEEIYNKFEKEIIDNTYNDTFHDLLTPPYISINKIRFEGK